jgi:hypothetical protein
MLSQHKEHEKILRLTELSKKYIITSYNTEFINDINILFLNYNNNDELDKYIKILYGKYDDNDNIKKILRAILFIISLLSYNNLENSS